MRTNAWRLLLSTVVASLAAFGGVLLLPPTAHACSCVAAGAEQHAENADAVFVGTVEDRDVRHPSWPLISSGDPATYRISVDRVYKGEVGAVALVESAGSGASCGIEVDVGRDYLVYADRDRSGDLAASLCGGTRPAVADTLAAAERALGTPGPPDATIAVPDQLSALPWLGAGAAVAGSVLAAAALGVLLRRRARP